MKEDGRENDLLQRLADDTRVPFSAVELRAMVTDFQQFTGRAEKQTEEFLATYVRPRLQPFEDILGKIDAELSV